MDVQRYRMARRQIGEKGNVRSLLLEGLRRVADEHARPEGCDFGCDAMDAVRVAVNDQKTIDLIATLARAVLDFELAEEEARLRARADEYGKMLGGGL